jgi:hypothetical protein
MEDKDQPASKNFGYFCVERKNLSIKGRRESFKIMRLTDLRSFENCYVEKQATGMKYFLSHKGTILFQCQKKSQTAICDQKPPVIVCN